MQTMDKVVFLSYDLTFDGDYDGLYKWLDNHHAVECGGNLCKFVYHTDELSSLNSYNDSLAFLDILAKDLLSHIKVSNRDRFYVVSEFIDNSGNKVTAGAFLFGQRKESPWNGRGDNAVNKKIKTLDE